MFPQVRLLLHVYYKDERQKRKLWLCHHLGLAMKEVGWTLGRKVRFVIFFLSSRLFRQIAL